MYCVGNTFSSVGNGVSFQHDQSLHRAGCHVDDLPTHPDRGSLCHPQHCVIGKANCDSCSEGGRGGEEGTGRGGEEGMGEEGRRGGEVGVVQRGGWGG